jgi:hypothetical protein
MTGPGNLPSYEVLPEQHLEQVQGKFNDVNLPNSINLGKQKAVGCYFSWALTSWFSHAMLYEIHRNNPVHGNFNCARSAIPIKLTNQTVGLPSP